MPLIDLPLAKLKRYRGRNPKPADFERYWERALTEMRAVDPQLELVKSDFQTPIADCFDLYWTGVRKARIHAKYIRPRNCSKPHPAVLQFHGYTGNAGDWCDKLNYAALGFSVAALDCRGQGGTSEDTGGIKGTTYRGHIIRGLNDSPDQLLFRHIFLDTAQLARIVMDFPEVDARRVGAMGGSQGGGLTLACVALEPRIRRAVPMVPFLSDYKRVWEMDLAKDAYEELKTFFRQFDPRHEREADVFKRLGYIDIQHLAPRIQARVLMGTGLMDTVCPPSTQFAVYNKIRSPKAMALYPDFGHEVLPGFQDRAFQFMAKL
ncbi:MAG: alpha/beta fold hydrolase [Verrucomicrobiota bacterium]